MADGLGKVDSSRRRMWIGRGGFDVKSFEDIGETSTFALRLLGWRGHFQSLDVKEVETQLRKGKKVRVCRSSA